MAVASDLEGTLTAGRTWKGLGRFLLASPYRRAYQFFFARRMPLALLARVGARDEQRFQERWIADLLGLLRGCSVEEFERMAEWVVENEMWPGRYEPLLQELAAHQRAGRRVLIVSATYQPVLERFAQRIGAEALGTPLEVADGKLTGRLLGEVNSAANKVARLQTALGGAALVEVFGDTLADVPMLTLGERAAVVNPKPALDALARRNGWRVLSVASALPKSS